MLEFDFKNCARTLQLQCDSTSWHVVHQVTMQDYRNEVKEFFSGDEQLAAEVEFALKSAEKEREMEEQMDNCSLAGDAKTPIAQGRTHHMHNNDTDVSTILKYSCVYVYIKLSLL